MTEGLGNFTMVVDLNRQSLDRVIPGIVARAAQAVLPTTRAGTWPRRSTARRLTACVRGRRAVRLLRAHIDAMSERGLPGSSSRSTRPTPATSSSSGPTRCLRCGRPPIGYDDDEPRSASSPIWEATISALLLDTFAECDRRHRPARRSLFAYTIKGWGLPIAGDPLNHAKLLDPRRDRRVPRPARADRGRHRVGPLRPGDTSAGQSVRRGRQASINNPRPVPRPRPALAGPRCGPIVSEGSRCRPRTPSGGCSRAWPTSTASAERIVTTAPDVSISTNLGGWINKTGRVLARASVTTTAVRSACSGGRRQSVLGTSSSSSASAR